MERKPMLKRQAKALSDRQIRTVLTFLDNTRHPQRNRLIFLLSARAGLRAKEIAHLRWSMVTDSEGQISDVIRLTDDASKGSTGGVIPMAKQLRQAFLAWANQLTSPVPHQYVVQTRQASTSPQVIVNLFQTWYRELGFDGCSSHSGRRTFITNAARNIGRFGGSLRDVQALARHSSLAMTQTYIEIDSEAMRRVVDV